jgi:hypothetical protein
MKTVLNLAPIVFTAAAISGTGLRSVDLFGRSPIPESVGISFRAQGNAVAPGSGKTVTVYYALAPSPNMTIAELGGAASNQELALPAGAGGHAEFTLPVIVAGQRYLYLWFDHTAFDAGAGLTLTPVINT